MHPGTLLETCSDGERTTAYAVELIQKLHRPLKVMKLFATLNDWFQGLEAFAPQGEFNKVDSQTILSTMFDETFYHSGHTRRINLEFMVAAGFQIIFEYCDQPGNQVILAQKIDV